MDARRTPLVPILLASAALAGFLIWWIYFKTAAASDAAWIGALPAWNATFNTLCAACLIAGYVQIRRGRRERHKRLMLAALGCSALFLASYLLYHHFHGDTPFGGDGPIRVLYFAILASHIVLSVAMLPMILTTLSFALRGRFARHRRIARYTLPVWLYVSVTGVLIFFFLKAYS